MQNIKYLSELEKAKSAYLQKRILDQSFETATLLSESICLRLSHQLENNPKIINDLLNEYYQNLNEILKIHKSYKVLIIEKIFVNLFAQFEEYVSDVYKILFKHFPKFLNLDDVRIRYNDLFEQNNIEYLRFQIIERRVKSIIQSSNTFVILDKFKKIFGIDFKVETDIANKLFSISQQRNIIVHNSGIVNDIYISEFRKFGIDQDLKIGDYVLEKTLNHTDMGQISGFLFNIVEAMNIKFKEDFSRLEQHHNVKVIN